VKFTVHVASIEEVPAAREAAEPLLQEGDELEIVVDSIISVPRPAESQPERQAVGHPAQVK
jgi:hypothetical protein